MGRIFSCRDVDKFRFEQIELLGAYSYLVDRVTPSAPEDMRSKAGVPRLVPFGPRTLLYVLVELKSSPNFPVQLPSSYDDFIF